MKFLVTDMESATKTGWIKSFHIWLKEHFLSNAVAQRPLLLLRQIYDEHGFESRPECIYNMDETGVPLEPCLSKVVARKGQKKI